MGANALRIGASAIAVLVLASACAGQSVNPPPPPGGGGTPVVTVLSRTDWVQVWSDEFEGAAGSGVDAAKWRPDTADGCSSGNCGWGNQEKEYYRTATENLSLDGGGNLSITARTAPSGLACYYGACRYTSAKITTRGRLEAGPGMVEARIKLPIGQGLWPAFWMLGTDFPTVPWPACGELDIMEFRGSRPANMSSAVHGPGYSGNTPFAHEMSLSQGRFSDGFHTFTVAWNSQSARFFVDDTLHFEVLRSDVQRFGNWVFDKPFFVILNLAVGGHFDGDPLYDGILPATMLVDYVRAYRLAP